MKPIVGDDIICLIVKTNFHRSTSLQCAGLLPVANKKSKMNYGFYTVNADELLILSIL